MGDRRILVVDGSGASEFRTIADALKASLAGDTVLLRIGQYDERVVVDKDVIITACEEAALGDAVVVGGIVLASPHPILRKVAVRQQLEIRSGEGRVENCDISLGADCVRVCRGANPTIVQCKIHEAQSSGDGIYFQEGAKGVVEECEIYQNRMNGIQVNGAEVVLRRNKIHHCPYGIFFRRGATGVVEGNNIERVDCFGVYIQSGSDPHVVKNTIMNCDIDGILISAGGAGNLTDNIIHAQVRILKGCAPVLGSNTFGRLDDENRTAVTAAA